MSMKKSESKIKCMTIERTKKIYPYANGTQIKLMPNFTYA